MTNCMTYDPKNADTGLLYYLKKMYVYVMQRQSEKPPSLLYVAFLILVLNLKQAYLWSNAHCEISISCSLL